MQLDVHSTISILTNNMNMTKEYVELKKDEHLLGTC